MKRDIYAADCCKCHRLNSVRYGKGPFPCRKCGTILTVGWDNVASKPEDPKTDKERLP